MRVFIDTNILISASRSNTGTPFLAFLRATTYPNQAVICDQNVDELFRVYNRKFPDKIAHLERFLALSMSVLQIVSTPIVKLEAEKQIRDAADRPILRAAIEAKADILITGDKDFLESGVETPLIMTAAEFVAYEETK